MKRKKGGWNWSGRIEGREEGGGMRGEERAADGVLYGFCWRMLAPRGYR